MSVKHIIPALDKALDLVIALAEKHDQSTQAELARKLGISPSTCYRILQTLVAHDWLRPTTAGRHTFSTGLLPLLKPLTDYQRLFEYLQTPLEKLVAETGLTAKISVKQRDHAVTVYRIESSRGLSPTSKLGASFPLAYGSSGACLLADLDDSLVKEILKSSPKEVWRLQQEDDVWKRIQSVRKQGVCYDPGQFQSPVHGVSAPIHGPDGRTFSSITLVGWQDDFTGKRLAQYQTQIKACATECTARLNQPTAA